MRRVWDRGRWRNEVLSEEVRPPPGTRAAARPPPGHEPRPVLTPRDASRGPRHPGTRAAARAPPGTQHVARARAAPPLRPDTACSELFGTELSANRHPNLCPEGGYPPKVDHGAHIGSIGIFHKTKITFGMLRSSPWSHG